MENATDTTVAAAPDGGAGNFVTQEHFALVVDHLWLLISAFLVFIMRSSCFLE